MTKMKLAAIVVSTLVPLATVSWPADMGTVHPGLYSGPDTIALAVAVSGSLALAMRYRRTARPASTAAARSSARRK